MVEVVGPRIDGQFVQHGRIEHRLDQQHGIGGLQDGQGPLDQVVIRADGHARPADVKRDRAAPIRAA